MDPLTQGVLGAALAQSAASRERMNAAAVAGVLGGMAPDLDVVIRSSSDALLAVEFHRHFTHSLVFIPIGGILLGFLLSLLWKKPERKWLMIFATLGWATHGLLDACTSYGTQLLWPFSNLRVAWSNIGIIDPVPTLAWLMAMALALYFKKNIFARTGLAIGVAYLLAGVWQHQRASDVQAKLIAERGHQASRAEVKPTVLNLFVWRSIYQEGNRYHVDAIRVGLAPPKIYPGESIERFTPAQLAVPVPENSVLARDIVRFTWFSDGWISLHPAFPNVIGDVRYALLPNEIRPLWGITVNPAEPDRHVSFDNFRQPNREVWQKFWKMLRGE